LFCYATTARRHHQSIAGREGESTGSPRLACCISMEAQQQLDAAMDVELPIDVR
jgi:hypothetical protein